VNDKPFDLIVAETRKKLWEVLEENGLPITVSAMILREMALEVSRQEKAQIYNLQQIENQGKEK